MYLVDEAIAIAIEINYRYLPMFKHLYTVKVV